MSAERIRAQKQTTSITSAEAIARLNCIKPEDANGQVAVIAAAFKSAYPGGRQVWVDWARLFNVSDAGSHWENANPGIGTSTLISISDRAGFNASAVDDGGAQPEPVALYGIEKLRAASQGAQAMICGSEKAAKVAQKLCDALGMAVVAVAWHGGPKFIEHADWKAIQGRSAVLLLSEEEAGGGLARLKEILDGVAVELKEISAPGGVSIADAPEGFNLKEHAKAHLKLVWSKKASENGDIKAALGTPPASADVVTTLAPTAPSTPKAMLIKVDGERDRGVTCR